MQKAMEKFKEASDFAKTVAFFLVYVVYMTWWAAGITAAVEHNSEVINTYVAQDSIDIQTLRISSATQSELLRNIVHLQQKQSDALSDLVKITAGCAESHKSIEHRIEKIEKRLEK